MGIEPTTCKPPYRPTSLHRLSDCLSSFHCCQPVFPSCLPFLRCGGNNHNSGGRIRTLRFRPYEDREIDQTSLLRIKGTVIIDGGNEKLSRPVPWATFILKELNLLVYRMTQLRRTLYLAGLCSHFKIIHTGFLESSINSTLHQYLFGPHLSPRYYVHASLCFGVTVFISLVSDPATSKLTSLLRGFVPAPHFRGLNNALFSIYREEDVLVRETRIKVMFPGFLSAEIKTGFSDTVLDLCRASVSRKAYPAFCASEFAFKGLP